MKINKNYANARIGWIDAWKAILIVLVVAGHVFGMISHYVPECEKSFYDFIFKLIYSFHMPAFFMLAGLMTSEGSQSVSTTSRFCKLFKRLLVPYFFFGLLGAIVYAAVMPCLGTVFTGVTGHYNQFGGGEWWHPWVSLMYGATFPGTDGFRCNSVLWFLPCMFSVKLINASVLCKVGTVPRAVYLSVLMILFMVVFGWACQFVAIPPLPYGFSKVLWYSPFFLSGYLLRPILVTGFAKGLFNVLIGRRIAVLFMLMIFVAVVWVLPENTIHARLDIRWYIVEVALGVLGSLSSMVVAMEISQKFPRACFQLSVNSIGIMFLHKYIVLSMIMGVPLARRLLSECLGSVSALVSLFVIVVSTATAWAISACVKRFAPWTIGAV